MTRRYDRDELLAALSAAGVPYVLHTHKPVFTVEEAACETDHLPGAHIKNLFLKDKAGALYLVTCLHERRVDLNKLAKGLGAAKGRLSFASEDVLWETLGVKPGSVTPLGLVNAGAGAIRFVLDNGVLEHDIVNPHPLQNDATLALSPADMTRVIESWGHTIEWLDLINFLRENDTL
ncbi:MAG: hypothetical protein COY40_00765 [Alphaproteobacteria bacterium CG_4_10_14_0_8_um_filter_53_9]|nr:MAG: hypothetical protein COY40_00765 [Alphaproteobacteria bacterium CG_4_10_14_0_8_um_filter_53_9]